LEAKKILGNNLLKEWPQGYKIKVPKTAENLLHICLCIYASN